MARKRTGERSETRRKNHLRRIHRYHAGICQICGVETSFDDYTHNEIDGSLIPGSRYPTREHIVDIHISKDDSDGNVTLACNTCNQRLCLFTNQIIACIERQRKGYPLVGKPYLEHLGITFEMLPLKALRSV